MKSYLLAVFVLCPIAQASDGPEKQPETLARQLASGLGAVAAEVRQAVGEAGRAAAALFNYCLLPVPSSSSDTQNSSRVRPTQQQPSLSDSSHASSSSSVRNRNSQDQTHHSSSAPQQSYVDDTKES